MSKLKYFDCNCSIGRLAHPALYDNINVKGLKEEMATAGVEEALVFHNMARDSAPSLGNAKLIEELKDAEELHPAWVVLPHHTGEIPAPAQLLKDMEQAGVKAVRMYPTKDYHSFSLADWCSGELLSALAEARVPLLLDIEIVWWETIQTLLEKYPTLPIIATNVSYRHHRFIYPLFERYPQLHVETSRFFAASAFEDIVNRFGPGPIMFGTHMPFLTGTPAVSMLTYADISREAKEAISGGTLRSLLKEALS